MEDMRGKVKLIRPNDRIVGIDLFADDLGLERHRTRPFGPNKRRGKQATTNGTTPPTTEPEPDNAAD